MADHFQIDYLPVGEKSKGGDAIALRFGNLDGPRHEQIVMVIDGGTKESGDALVEHIRTHYGTELVDAVLVTHTDSDHVSGLTQVLNDLEVSALWMLQPWEIAPEINNALNGAYTNTGLTNHLKASLDQANDLAKIARAKGIPVQSPYAGIHAFNDMVRILGPSEAYYKELVPQFRSSPAAKAISVTASVFGGITNFATESINKVREDMNTETLKDGNEHFSAENNSSVIMLLTVGKDKILFTGDADADALTRAADYAEYTLGIPLNDLHMIHVPHHGSKHNVGPTILNRIKGKKAMISAPKESKKHPHQSVINAFLRRETRVYATQGTGVLHHSGFNRPTWTATSEPLPFIGEFED